MNAFPTLPGRSIHAPLRWALRCLLVAALSVNLGARVDQTFNVGSGAESTFASIGAMAADADGKLLIGGQFTSMDGRLRPYLARLNPDGSLDTNFDPGLGPNLPVQTIAVQSDGRILIGGAFTQYDGSECLAFARLWPDGRLDRESQASRNLFSGAPRQAEVNEIAVEPGGSVLVRGFFYRASLLRLSSAGVWDQAFNEKVNGKPNGPIRSMAVQPDGALLLGGDFTAFGDKKAIGLVRLNRDGTPDLAFEAATGTQATVNKVALQRDGKILVAGMFPVSGSPSAQLFLRLAANGSLDSAFDRNNSFRSPGVAQTIFPLPDQRIFVSGQLAGPASLIVKEDGTMDGAAWTNVVVGAYAVWGQQTYLNVHPTSGRADSVGRWNANLTPDLLYRPPTVRGSAILQAVNVQTNVVYVGGNFTSFQGMAVQAVARLALDGAIDPSFRPGSFGEFNTSPTPAAHVRALLPLPDGRLVIGGAFSSVGGVKRLNLARLKLDGSIDETFVSQVSDLNVIVGLLPDFNGKILYASKYAVGRLHPDGSVDASFKQVYPDNEIFGLARDTNNAIVITGYFKQVNGKPAGTVARLSPDGVLDENYLVNAALFNGGAPVRAVAVQPDNKILIGGEFDARNKHHLVRLGSLFPSLDPNWDSWLNFSGEYSGVYRLLVQTNRDNRILVGGRFTAVSSSSASGSANGLARLEANGKFDRELNPLLNGGVDFSYVQSAGFDYAMINDFAVDGGGAIYAAGRFRSVDHLARGSLVRLVDDGYPGFGAFATNLVQVSEGAGNVVLQLTRTGGSAGAVSVTWETVPRSNVVSFAQGSVAWPANDSAPKPITIPFVGKKDSMFWVVLSRPIGGMKVDSGNSLGIYITAGTGRPVMTSATAVTGTNNLPFVYQIVANNNPTRFSANGLASWMRFDSQTGVIQGTSSQNGRWQVGITAANGQGESTTNVTVWITSSYDQWTRQLPAGSDPNPGADPNRNGLPNLVEYALGYAPNDSAMKGLTVNRAGSDLFLNLTRISGGLENSLSEYLAGGVTCRLEVSSDLKTWQPVLNELVKANSNVVGNRESVSLKIQPRPAVQYYRLWLMN